MPPVEETPPVETAEKEGPIKTVIGIIYPPPEVRNIVDKTASFVARNGPEFETRIRQNELNNPKFNFLNPNDPYHAYYQHKVKEFKEGKGYEPLAPKTSQMPVSSLLRPMQEVKVSEPIVPKEPPPEMEFIADPPSISAFDLDVVKLTAQFVARNGRQFLTNLMNREKNYQFDFLRPQHSLFNYFTKLVEQYTKVLIPPKDLVPKLRREADTITSALDQVKYRVEWAKYQERERRKEEEAIERERVAYAAIDWHDFVVVETVDFQYNESGNFPPPTTPEEVGARVIAQERFETTPQEDEAVEMEVESESDSEDEEEDEDVDGDRATPPLLSGGGVGDNIQVQDMEEDSEDEREDSDTSKPSKREKVVPPPPPPPADVPKLPPLPPNPDQVIVRKDYNPKAAKATAPPEPESDQYLISPITGQAIPVSKIQEHMRIGLLDSKWKEQRDRALAEKREQEEVYAIGSAISGNLRQLAERRTDIFGAGAEEAQIGKKIGEEEKRVKEKVTWDGHTASMERVTQKARENISIEEQIAVIHKVKGLLPDEEKEKIGPAMPKSSPHQPPPPPPVSMPSSLPSAPPQPPKQPPVPPPPRPPVQPPQPPQQVTITMPQRPPQQMMVMPPRPPMAPPGMRGHLVAHTAFIRIPARPPMPPNMGGPPPGMHMGPPGAYMHRMPPPPQHAPPQHHPPPSMDDEPPNKKQKTEENLMPEDEFLRRFKGPVNFKVAVPNMSDKPEWKLGGQMLNFTLPLTDSVAVIKAKIHEVVGMPAGKQKIQYDGLFLKDSNTLAFYNVNHGAIVQLQLKERGGRKK